MEDQRRTQILKISGEVLYKPIGSMVPPVAVMVRELRNNGLKFITTEKLELQTVLELAIRVTEDSDPISAQGVVVWQGHGSSRFLLDTSIEFAEISAKDESRLLNFLTNSAEHIKAGRCHVRCPMEVFVRYAKEENPNEFFSGQTGDIGILGMKLFVSEDIPSNSDLKLVFDLPRGRGTVEAKGTVVWKGAQSEEQYSIGVRFTDIDNKDKKMILRYINHTISESSLS